MTPTTGSKRLWNKVWRSFRIVRRLTDSHANKERKANMWVHFYLRDASAAGRIQVISAPLSRLPYKQWPREDLHSCCGKRRGKEVDDWEDEKEEGDYGREGGGKDLIRRKGWRHATRSHKHQDSSYSKLPTLASTQKGYGERSASRCFPTASPCPSFHFLHVVFTILPFNVLSTLLSFLLVTRRLFSSHTITSPPVRTSSSCSQYLQSCLSI